MPEFLHKQQNILEFHRNIPRTSKLINTKVQSQCCCKSTAQSALIIASVEPIDRSMPFVVITKVIAHAAIKTGALCLNKFSMFLFEKESLCTY